MESSQHLSCNIIRLERLAQDCLGKHNLDGAVFYSQLLVSFSPDHKAQRGYVFGLANALYLRRDYQRAVHLLRRYRLVDNDPRAKYLCAQCLFATERYDECLDMLDSAKNGHVLHYYYEVGADLNLHSSIFYLRGQVYLAMENLKDARENFAKAFCTDPYNYQAFQALLARQTPRQLAQCIQDASAHVRPEDSYLLDYYRLHVQQELQKDFISHVQRELLPPQRVGGAPGGEDSQGTEPYNATLASERTDDKGVVLVSRSTLYTSPPFRLCRVQLLHARGLHHAASTTAKQMLEEDHLDRSVLPLALTLAFVLGDVSYLQGKAMELMRQYREQAVAYFAVGCLELIEDRLEGAINMFGRAFSLKQPFPGVALFMGRAYERQGDLDNAVQAYRKGLKFFPGSVQLHCRLASLYMRKGVHQEARITLQQAEDLGEEGDPELFMQMGRYSLEVADYRDAESHLLRAVQLCDRFDYSEQFKWRVLLNYAQSQLHLQQRETARKVLKAASQLSPHNHDVTVAMAVVELLDGNLQEAQWYVTRASVYKPECRECVQLQEAMAGLEANLLQAFPAENIQTDEFLLEMDLPPSDLREYVSNMALRDHSFRELISHGVGSVDSS